MQTFIEDLYLDLTSNPVFSNVFFSILVVIVSFLILFLVQSLIKKYLKHAAAKQIHVARFKTLSKLLFSLLRYSVFIIAILVILSIWGVDVVPAIAGLGIIGLVIGLGAQRMIQDMIAGFFIVFENHYDIGDIVEVNGFKGNVLELGLKSTTLQHWTGHIQIFSNSHMSPVMNYSRYFAQALVTFSVPYDADIKVLSSTLNTNLKMLKENTSIISDVIVLGVTKFLASGIELTVTCQTKPNLQYGVEREIRLFLLEQLKQLNIEIPFDHIVISSKDPS
ncbi:MAG: mechanosensitive ion channel family protein [Acholeplasmataceae bacterium]